MDVGSEGSSLDRNRSRTRTAEGERQRVVTGGSAITTTVRYDGGVAVVAVRGDLDPATAPLLVASVDAMVRKGQRHVVVDLSDVTFIDGAGLAGLESIADLPAVTFIRFSTRVRQLVSQFGLAPNLHDAAAEAGREAMTGPPGSRSD